jgi:glycosyltransferase involved in cell wall biosynthesis
MLVSVVIPCYNVELYIAECIQSVINQTHKDIEIICIDNNSVDSTWELLKDLQIQYPHIILDKELKPGACAARNKGLLKAKGDWVQFLDADDLLLKTKLEHQLKLLASNQSIEASFIAATCQRINLNGSVAITSGLEFNPYLAPFINKCGNTCSNLWNRKALLSVGMWNEHLKSSQETDLMLNLILKGHKYLIDDEPFTLIRERASGQISQRNPSEKWQQYIDIRLQYIDKLKEESLTDFLKIRGILYDFLMVSIITLGKYDEPKALNYYKKYIKNNWQSAYTSGFSKLKVKMIQLFGLKFLLKG